MDPMKPTIKYFGARTVLGTESGFISDGEAATLIPKHWQLFNQRRAEIKTVVQPKTSYGIIMPERNGTIDGMRYLACVEVSDSAAIPKGMKLLSVPAGNYAVFTFQGPIMKIAEAMEEIYGKWIPANEAKLRHAAHLEVYDERFDPTSDSSIVEICVPVK